MNDANLSARSILDLISAVCRRGGRVVVQADDILNPACGYSACAQWSLGGKVQASSGVFEDGKDHEASPIEALHRLALLYTGRMPSVNQQLTELLRRDWSMRVLDYAKRNGYEVTETISKYGPEDMVAAGNGAFVKIRVAYTATNSRHFVESDTDEPQVAEDHARRLAALWLFSALRADEQDHLGECP